MTAIPSPNYSEVRETPVARSGVLGGITLNWETGAYIAILIMAIFTRFYILGDRVMSHDESLHTQFSYNLYRDGTFIHTPLMHGPILFHATAFSYFMFGDNDYSARLYPAILGVIMTVLFPILFRRWLGTWGALLMAVMLLISPIWMYYNRYIREDTPNIFALFLLLYCMFMYLDGPRRLKRKARWLYIGAFALLWHFGSKETGFMYAGVIGLFLMGYFVIRLYQHFRKTPSRTLFEGAVLGTLVGSVAALLMYIVISIALQPYPTLEDRAEYISTRLAGLFSGQGTSIEFAAFINWTLLVAALAIGLIVGTMFYVYWNRRKLPLREMAVILLIALAACVTLVYFEELSQTPSRDEVTTAPDPTVTTEVVEGPVNRDVPVIVATWIVCGAVILAVIYGTTRGLPQRAKVKHFADALNEDAQPTVVSKGNMWRTLHRFPEFDIILLFLTLILPWLTPVLISLTGASPVDYSANGIARALALGIPLGLVSIVLGLAWNWKRFLIYAACFYVPFVFFFTTMFTNPNGIATGIVGSLGYWIEQQGVRRGSQPQYYYQLIVMPMYEYLPIIGSILAMMAGMVVFWRRRANEIDYNEQQRTLLTGTQSATDEVAVVHRPDADLEVVRAPDLEPMAVGDYLRSQPRRSALLHSAGKEFSLTRLSFILFMAWLAVGNLLGFTLAGEKMPWLGTHLTVPMIILTAWYFGKVFEKIEWSAFFKRGWLLLILLPLLFIILFQLARPFIVGETIFGLQQAQLERTGQWLGVLAVAALVLFFIWQVSRATSGLHLRRMLGVAAFAFLSVITFRAAWTASFINYDYATEFLVYAHAAPGWTLMMDQVEDISRRTTNGMDVRFAWGGNAWPASWYFRELRNATFFGSNPTPQQLNDAVAVYASADIRGRVEPLLEERYVRFDYTRMWWPMQDYFNLNATRVLNALDFSGTNPQAGQIRQGIFDIWWARDYTLYGQATGGSYNVTSWPVSETMHFYVRRDVAAQIWDLGVGDATVVGPTTETVNLCVTNWQPSSAMTIFNTPSTGALNVPIDIAIGADGLVYVADQFGNRVAVFNADGQYMSDFSIASSATGRFERPNGVAVAPDGNVVVADTWNYRVQLLDAEGLPIMGWGQAGQFGDAALPDPVDGFWGPRDVAVDAQGNIYVADTGNKRVRVYDSQGNYLRDIGGSGAGEGRLNEPSGLAIAPDGRLFVADTWNRRVAIFAPDGSFQSAFMVRGWYDDLGNRPYLAIDETRGQLYVTDPDAGRVLVYDLSGNCLGSFGQPGDDNLSANQFRVTAGVAVDADGNVYVVDSGAGRVLKFPPFNQPPAADQAQG
ncbi:MAG: TIGR03663 family protein [Chloroflexota bacterium]|nr:TIGR03663 family protein [Chloroflexota bacterium]